MKIYHPPFYHTNAERLPGHHFLGNHSWFRYVRWNGATSRRKYSRQLVDSSTRAYVYSKDSVFLVLLSQEPSFRHCLLRITYDFIPISWSGRWLLLRNLNAMHVLVGLFLLWVISVNNVPSWFSHVREKRFIPSGFFIQFLMMLLMGDGGGGDELKNKPQDDCNSTYFMQSSRSICGDRQNNSGTSLSYRFDKLLYKKPVRNENKQSATIDLYVWSCKIIYTRFPFVPHAPAHRYVWMCAVDDCTCIRMHVWATSCVAPLYELFVAVSFALITFLSEC